MTRKSLRILSLSALAGLFSIAPARAETLVLFGTEVRFSADREPEAEGSGFDGIYASEGQPGGTGAPQGGETAAGSGDPEPFTLEYALTALNDFLEKGGTPAEALQDETWRRASRIHPPQETPGDSGTATALAWADDDEVEIRNAGLSAAEITRTMEDLGPELRACVPDRDPVAGEMDLQMDVAPGGSVQAVSVVGTRGPEVTGGSTGARAPDAATAGCVERVLAEATFPVHEQPGGFTFGYVLRLDF